jgi:hypothetical protein
VKGPENDSATKGSTPDDSRADEVHLVEPKDITKKKVAEAQEEPAGLQVPLAALSQTTYIADSPIWTFHLPMPCFGLPVSHSLALLLIYSW